jgi:chromosome segregation ATPase
MKNFHQNLLVVLALALCVLCAYQWYGQTLQRGDMEREGRLLNQQLVIIQEHTNTINTLQGQLEQLDGHITELRATISTNDGLILTQKRELNRLQAENESFTNQIVEYKHAVEAYKDKLEEAYGGIKKQNEAISNLVAQRDDLVKKLNDSVKDRNDIVAKYNTLAAQVEKLQRAKQ